MESNFFYRGAGGNHGKYIVFFFNDHLQEEWAIVNEHIFDCFREPRSVTYFLCFDAVGFRELDKIGII
jgi:hypothetical protein